MVRMLDILKLRRKKEEPAASKPVPPPPAKTPEKPAPEKPSEEKGEITPTPPLTHTPPVADASAMSKIILGKVDKIPPEDVYQRVLNLITEVIQKGAQNDPVETKVIKEQIEKLIDQMYTNSDAILEFVTSRTEVEDYMYGHSVNVCLLSLAVGIELNYDRNKLVELGIGALLHDIGMVKVLNIADKPTKLTAEEYEEVKKHPIYGVEILEKVTDFNSVVVYIINQHHERADGSGYPKGFSGEQINEYARIVAITDVYDALIHPRKYRSKMLPHEAIKEVVKEKAYFDPVFLKALLDKISIYPIGSTIELSSGEIAMVTATNRQSPLRPAVKILADSQGHKLEEPRILNLAEHITVYIKKPVSYNLE